MASTSFQQQENEEHEGIIVIDVWNHNFKEEIAIITNIIKEFKVVTFDTEFPVTLIKVPSNAPKYTLLPYAGMRENDDKGNLPKDENEKDIIWQFNFSDFDPDKSLSNPRLGAFGETLRMSSWLFRYGLRY
ncbi:probable CCR4-associated factor 1 homolog 2 [Impatiens glandulifera]|uniref:probable CCR4-associated factor 1 homolog 2 n=1 Tax=Impatiens glandulifera TaxID=253017 RepID=UPI001FB0C4FD|nr:probable CCR4-associated factor 1 homolog 2 [Impatiens glandulifera]